MTLFFCKILVQVQTNILYIHSLFFIIVFIYFIFDIKFKIVLKINLIRANIHRDNMF